MSMHKTPLTELERNGLTQHGLPIGTPSQLSDAFRLGIAWALSQHGEQQPMVTKTEKGCVLHVGWDDLPAGTKLYAGAAPAAQQGADK